MTESRVRTELARCGQGLHGQVLLASNTPCTPRDSTGATAPPIIRLRATLRHPTAVCWLGRKLDPLQVVEGTQLYVHQNIVNMITVT